VLEYAVGAGAVFSCCGCAAPLQLLAGTAAGTAHVADVNFTGTPLPNRGAVIGFTVDSLWYVRDNTAYPCVYAAPSCCGR